MNQSFQYKHLFWMAICCLAVIGAIIILPRYFNIGTIGFILLILLCPALHYFMMRKMHKPPHQYIGGGGKKDGERGDVKTTKK